MGRTFLFMFHSDKRNDHLFHRDASMLEGVGESFDVFAMIVGVDKEIVGICKDVI